MCAGDHAETGGQTPSGSVKNGAGLTGDLQKRYRFPPRVKARAVWVRPRANAANRPPLKGTEYAKIRGVQPLENRLDAMFHDRHSQRLVAYIAHVLGGAVALCLQTPGGRVIAVTLEVPED